MNPTTDKPLEQTPSNTTSSTAASNTAQLQALRNANVPRGISQLLPIFAARAQGATLTDVEGREFIDFAGGIGVLNTGHTHPKVVAAIQAQLEQFTHTCFQVVPYESYLRLAEKLNALVPGGPNKTMFVSTGAEATENAIKIARAYTGRPAVVSLEHSFHGRTLLGMSLTGKEKPYRTGFGPFAPEVYKIKAPYAYRCERSVCPRNGGGCTCSSDLQTLFETQVDPSKVACIIVEPVMGEGGFVPLPTNYLLELRRICDQHGIVFISDEIQSGFGRTGGKLWAIEHAGIVPDLLTSAKSIAGGLPLAAVTGRADIMDAPQVGGLGGTYAGNPLACAAGLAVLEIFEEENILEQGQILGERLERELESLFLKYPGVGEHRGLGAMRALELVKNRDTREPDAESATQIVNAALERGLILIKAGMYGNVLRFLMPLNISDTELERGLKALHGAFAAVYER